MIRACKEHKDTVVNPIYRFTDSDIWQYIRDNNISVNPLYARGYKRVGCIGCPMGTPKQQRRQFAEYPKYKDNYIRAFDRMIERHEVSKRNWANGIECYKWWLGENPKQVTFDDILGGDT